MNELPQSAGIRIRQMSLDDLPSVEEIDRLSFSLPWPKNAYRFELLENPSSLTYVAELISPADAIKLESPKIVGLCVIWIILDEAHIATLATHPNYRRLGIARQMLVKALQESIARGCTSATLEVRAHNLAAQALYQAFGFAIVGSRPKYYQDNLENALIMTVSPLDLAYQQRLMEGAAIQQTVHTGEPPAG